MHGIPLFSDPDIDRRLTLSERVDYRSGSIRTHYVGGRSAWSFQLLVQVLAQITYRNELIGSFNTFCTGIRPTGRLMAGIPLLFVRVKRR